ncbi:hypothetical protein [Paenibacillus sp. O199]|uniref:hypothetical protein n=1 Tax=Paenibacillus sp. O199 TaxID=1643925 RepID=UPI0007BF6246|nr:hypothetical protein [Paenibacillus sp. O199]
MEKVSNTINLQELIKASGLKITSEQLVESIVEQYTMSQEELVDRFHFSNQRIKTLREKKLIREIKKGLYLREQVENMREKQIREKRLEKFGDYRLTPAYEEYEDSLIIDKLRFYDCLTCVRAESKSQRYNPQNDEYNIHLTEVLKTVLEAFNAGKDVYFFEHRAFQYVRYEEDIQKVIDSNNYWFKKHSVSQFLDLLQMPVSEYLGFQEIMNYSSIVKSLTKLEEE